MKVGNIEITNFNRILDYQRYRAILNNRIFGFNALEVMDRTKVTMTLSEVTALEVLYLKPLCSTVKIISLYDTSEENIKERELDENFIQAIKENNNFFKLVEEDEKKSFSYLYKTILEKEFDLICILKPEVLEQLGTSMDRMYKMGTEELLDESYNGDEDYAKSVFADIFFKLFYRNMESKLNENDTVVDKLMLDKYYKHLEISNVVFLECTAPFEGIFGIDHDDEESIQKFLQAKDRVKANDMEDEVELYFVCNTSFYTYFILQAYYGLEVDCRLPLELLSSNLYMDESLLEKYEARLNNYFGPVLAERTYEGSDRTIAMRLLTSTFNTSITYGLKVPLTKIPMLEAVSDIQMPDTDVTDFKPHLDKIVSLSKIVDNFFHQ